MLAAGRTIMGGGRVDRAVARRRWPCARCDAAADAQGPARWPRWPRPTRSAPAVLLRQAALVVALSTRVGQLGPGRGPGGAARPVRGGGGLLAAHRQRGESRPGSPLRRCARPWPPRPSSAPTAWPTRRPCCAGCRRWPSARPTGWPGSRSGGTACTAGSGESAVADAAAAGLAGRPAARRHRQHRHVVDGRRARRRTPGHRRRWPSWRWTPTATCGRSRGRPRRPTVTRPRRGSAARCGAR